ncbi:hypothetical protein [Natronolimnohabitans innermongolicus]|uniref:Uncharacterized protein n=1 Tax=Natronolimnohabitans innermongolicus JCM 12255 TaxID=1227499 RepID=L9WZI0_9EURY|nr:hypothetical protein [Natronolimnohabitans innermongolicus]ELY54899.1 hypothetical protein C493_12007 [Natronolimnohabitans innermongolicus JCM 12255]
MRSFLPTDLEPALFAVVGLVLLSDVAFGVSDRLPDGWFHLLLGIGLVIAAIVLTLERRRTDGP